MTEENNHLDSTEYFSLMPDDDEGGALEQDPKEKNRFRDRCYHHTVTIIRLIKKLPKDQVNNALFSKLLHSATSIGASVVEAKTTKSKKRYIKCYETALKSATDTKYWLSLVRDTVEVNKTTINALLKENALISRTLELGLSAIKKSKNPPPEITSFP